MPVSPVFTLAAFTLSLPLPAGALVGAEESKLHVELAWVDPMHALPDAVSEVAQEVARVFAPVGLAVTWHSAGAGEETAADVVHAILLDADRGTSHGWAMGWTHRRPSATRTVWLLLPNIKRAIGLDPTQVRPLTGLDARLLARAVGRVVAHEVVHALAPGVSHASHGLMSDRLKRSALVAPRLALDADSARALFTALRLQAGVRAAR